MRERLKLSWERIREIPGETDQSTLHGVFFASLATFFLQFLKGREAGSLNEKTLCVLVQDCLGTSREYLYPEDALMRESEGDILSVLLYHSLGVVYEEEEEAICRILELFIELYLLMKSSSSERKDASSETTDVSSERQSMKDAFYAHFYDYTGDFLAEWFTERKREKDSLFLIHNPLFPLFFPYNLPSPFFTEEYEEVHRNDLALILGDRLLSHLKKEWKKLPSQIRFYPEPERWSGSPHALSFQAYQKKLLRQFKLLHFGI